MFEKVIFDLRKAAPRSLMIRPIEVFKNIEGKSGTPSMFKTILSTVSMFCIITKYKASPAEGKSLPIIMGETAMVIMILPIKVVYQFFVFKM